MALAKKRLDLATLVERMESGFADLPPVDCGTPGADRMDGVLDEVARRLHDNYPYFHPFYAGQMLKPPHPVAQMAYALAMRINPNNHALDGGRASSAMEKEAVAEIASMFGWKSHLGHLTSGGTFANLEALWMAGQINPGKKIVASSQAHYTHERISGVLHLPFEIVPVDAQAKMDCDALERLLGKGDVGCVVATMGTTAVGAVDPLKKILALKKQFGFRLHVAIFIWLRISQRIRARILIAWEKRIL
jgi:glutamate/tyrosine decarboxylase-like PLP-dependent enzyme